MRPESNEAQEPGAGHPVLRMLTGAATALAIFVIAWLLWVTGTVLPERNPGSIGPSRLVAIAYAAFTATSWRYVFGGSRNAVLRWTVVLESIAAVVFGGYLIATMVTAGSGHFEGYILLLGGILCLHGLTVLACIGTGRRGVRRAA